MIKHRVFHIIVSALLIALIVASGILYLCYYRHARSRAEQYAYESFRDKDTRYEQLSCFYPDGNGFDPEEILSLRGRLTDALTAISVTDPTLDAYSVDGELYLSSADGANSIQVTATAVGGDYFYFHPQNIVSGGYFSEDDFADDRVLIDRETAWALFGSDDVAGMSLTIGDKYYYISGVYEKESDSLAKLAYGEDARIFMSLSAYRTMYGDAKVSCFEMLIPSSVPGIGSNTFKENIGVDGCIYVENSYRYTLSRLYKDYFGDTATYRLMKRDTVTFPPYENIAVVEGSRAAGALLATLITAFIAFVILVAYAVIVIRYFWKKIKIKFNIKERGKESYEF